MNQLSYEIFYSVIFYTLSALLAIGVNVMFYLRARKSDLLDAFFNVHLMLIIWLIAKVFKKASPSDEMAWLWVVVQYLAVCFFGVVFLDFAFLYRKGRKIKRWIRKVLYIIGAMNYAVIFTNDFHHLFFKSVTISNNVYGPWFYVHMVFSYVLIIASYYYLINALVKNSYEVPLFQAFLFNIGLLVPILSNLVYIFDLVDFSFDITPIMFNVTIIIFGYSAYRYRFLDIKSVTRSMVLENIHEGIVIIDNSFRIVELNSVVIDVISHQGRAGISGKIGEFLAIGNKTIKDFEIKKNQVINCLHNQEEKLMIQFTMEVHGSDRSYFLKLEKIKDHTGDTAGYVFRFIDISQQQELIESLEESNKTLLAVNQQLSENISVTRQLASAKERSRVSKEVHDILGHSVTIAISLMEIAKRSIVTDHKLASEKVTQGMEIIRGGLIELKKSMKQHAGDAIFADQLTQDLEKLINDYEKSGVNVDFYYKASELKLSAEVYDTLYRVCQEGLTNALRHGKAKNVTIGLRYVDRNVDVFIIDDGVGCEEVDKGNGLSGMESQVKSLGGQFTCGSPDGQGFNVHVTLPYNSALQ